MEGTDPQDERTADTDDGLLERERTPRGEAQLNRESERDHPALVAHVPRQTRIPGLVQRLLTGFVLFVPPNYEIVGDEGTRFGTIRGEFKLRDPDISAEKERHITLPGMDAGYTYIVDLSNDHETVVDPRLAVLGAIAIDVADAAGTAR